MILGFKKQFEEPILAGSKIHTIREDGGGRWKPGKLMHMATGVRTKAYKCFDKKTCISVQRIEITHYVFNSFIQKKAVYIDGCLFGVYFDKNRYDFKLHQLAKNDGFASVSDFFDFFNTDFEGKIIH